MDGFIGGAEGDSPLPIPHFNIGTRLFKRNDIPNTRARQMSMFQLVAYDAKRRGI